MFNQLSMPLLYTPLGRMRKKPGLFDINSREFSSHATVYLHPAWHCIRPLGLTADEGNATVLSTPGFSQEVV